MTDTPDHINALQLQIWLAKTPMERLRKMMQDNDALFRLWNVLKKQSTTNSDLHIDVPDRSNTNRNIHLDASSVAV